MRENSTGYVYSPTPGLVDDGRPHIKIDPVMTLDLESLRRMHLNWEWRRLLLPAEYDQRARDWRLALANAPIGHPPTCRAEFGRA